jgi:hypothetical protein
MSQMHNHDCRQSARLTASQRASLESHLALDRRLLADTAWLAACKRREPAVRRNIRRLERMLGVAA